MITAMKRNIIRRLHSITAMGINDSNYKPGLYYTIFIIPYILWFYFRDKARQENLITERSLDWNIIKPGHFIWGIKTGNYKHDNNLGYYILTKMISHSDAAQFILNELEENKYLHQKPGITY